MVGPIWGNPIKITHTEKQITNNNSNKNEPFISNPTILFILIIIIFIVFTLNKILRYCKQYIIKNRNMNINSISTI